MTPERFRVLTEAYGSNPAHWPPSERAAAQTLLARGDAVTLAALTEAAQLDDWLTAHTVAAPEADLRRRILVAAPQTPAWHRPRVWWSGLGLAGAGLAGIVTGALVVSLLLPAFLNSPGVTELSYSSTAFGGITPDGSNE